MPSSIKFFNSLNLRKVIILICICVPFFVINSSFYFVTHEHNQDNQILPEKNVLYQRNELSYLLNKQRQIVGQLECTRGFHNISSSGAWCRNESLPTSSRHMTDFKLKKQLSKYLSGKRVGSFGDGPGLYKKYFDESKRLAVYEAYDGAPFAESVSSGNVKFLDLSVPQYGIPIYDWIVSLEVAEHIPKEYESTFLSNLVRHAKTGIILSWARPSQQGYGHVNGRDIEYVLDKMNELGFERNLEDSQLLQSHCSFLWLEKNTNVYFRRSEFPININDA